jgi:PhoPQ-activated pathogenicity-related protein
VQVYGRWPAAFIDYVEMNVTRCLNCPVFQELGAIEDPKVYLDRFLARRVPIVSVSAVGDEFFLPDGFQWWYYDYTGEKYLAIQPNAEHSMFNRIDQLSATLAAFMYTVEQRIPRPQFTWTISEDGSSITVRTAQTPRAVRVYSAYNERRGRAFILNCYLSCVWRATSLGDLGNNTYVASVSVPTVGYTGFFVEIDFEVGPYVPFLTVTTGVSIVPQTLPYPPCDERCARCDTCEPEKRPATINPA